MAPRLVQMQDKYKGRGVVFLGFTSRELENSLHYLQRHKVTWPNAYGIGELRSAAPVIFVIGGDGRIVWSDERARFRHSGENLIQALEDALENALRR